MGMLVGMYIKKANTEKCIFAFFIIKSKEKRHKTVSTKVVNSQFY